MRNTLPMSGAHRNESGIVNLMMRQGLQQCADTHWVAYAKKNNRVVYFDSFGNFRQLKKLVRYFGNDAMTIDTIPRPIRRTIRASVDRCVCGFYK